MSENYKHLLTSLANSKRAFLIAPAGYGKTYTIAETVAKYTEGRQLILTHTHAGVHALLAKLRERGADSSNFHVGTISGWALNYANAYPNLSGWRNKEPEDEDWIEVYRAASKLIANVHIQAVISTSYAGLFVDEYQDCTVSQHDLVLSLATVLPTRILGDPWQGIFGFRSDDPLVDWDKSIKPSFEALPQLDVPWRWNQKDSNKQLGVWLKELRRSLEENYQITFANSSVKWVQASYEKQRKACYSTPNAGSTIVIHHTKGQDFKFAKGLGKPFIAIDDIYSKRLFELCDSINDSQGNIRALLLIEYASECLSKVSTELKSIKDKINNNHNLNKIQKHKDIATALNDVMATPDLEALLTFCRLVQKIDGAYISRRDLWYDFIRTLENYDPSIHNTLRESAWAVRSRTSIIGRPTSRKVVSRTVLIKGLEFDHVVILDADQLDAKNLYVACTRGAKSLTVLSSESSWSPEKAKKNSTYIVADKRADMQVELFQT